MTAIHSATPAPRYESIHGSCQTSLPDKAGTLLGKLQEHSDQDVNGCPDRDIDRQDAAEKQHHQAPIIVAARHRHLRRHVLMR